MRQFSSEAEIILYGLLTIRGMREQFAMQCVEVWLAGHLLVAFRVEDQELILSLSQEGETHLAMVQSTSLH